MADQTPRTREYENIVSGAKISGTVYEKLNKGLKQKYQMVKSSKGKKTKTPEEAKNK